MGRDSDSESVYKIESGRERMKIRRASKLADNTCILTETGSSLNLNP